MTENESSHGGKASRDLATWFAGRKSDVEHWVEETCQRAIAQTRGLLAEEIRGLSRRVEKMHELLDQLERYVESAEEDQDDASMETGRERDDERGND